MVIIVFVKYLVVLITWKSGLYSNILLVSHLLTPHIKGCRQRVYKSNLSSFWKLFIVQALVVVSPWDFASSKRRQFWYEWAIALHITSNLVCKSWRVGIHADKCMVHASSLFYWGWLHQVLKVHAKIVQRMSL